MGRLEAIVYAGGDALGLYCPAFSFHYSHQTKIFAFQRTGVETISSHILQRSRVNEKVTRLPYTRSFMPSCSKEDSCSLGKINNPDQH
jgi:hypothetical protein